ncbi:MAG: AsmA family protein [Pseudomonadota bacterium]
MTNFSGQHEWYLARDNKRYGPVSEDELSEYFRSGHIQGTDLLWREGFENWVKAEALTSFFLPDQQQPQDIQSDVQSEQDAAFTAQPLVQSLERDEIGAAQPTAAINNRGQKKSHKAKRLFAKLAAATFLLIAFLGAAIYVLPTFVSADFIGVQIAAQVQEQTGRTLKINGKSTFSILPNLGVTLNNVVLSNPDGMAGGPLLQMSQVNLKLKILPLLSEKIEIEKVVIKSPKISLRIDQNTKNNWSFKKAELNSNAPIEQYAHNKEARIADAYHAVSELVNFAFSTSSPAHAQTAFALKTVKLDKVYVIDGAVSYYDDRNNIEQHITDMNFTFSLPENEALIFAQGRAKWNAEEVSFDGNITSPEYIIQGQVSPISADLQSQHFTLSLTGKLSTFEGLFFTGNADFQTASLRDMMEWLGHKASLKGGLNNFSLSGEIEAQAERINFKKAKVAIDNNKAEGQGTLLFSGAKPYLKALIKADKFHFDTYYANASSLNVPRKKALIQYDKKTRSLYNKEISLTSAPNPESASDTIDQVETVEASISARPVNTIASDLEAMDADINIQFKDIHFKKVQAQNGNILLEVRNGVLKANMQKFELYDGTGSGVFILNSKEAIPAFSKVLKLSNVSAEPFLRDVFRVQNFAGVLDMNYKIKGFGISEKQILTNLSGNGKLHFKSGFIKGINIPKSLKALKKGRLEGWSSDPNVKTRFTKLRGSFVVDKGVARTRDTEIEVPLSEKKDTKQNTLMAKAVGTIDFTKQWINYRVQPRLFSQKNGKPVSNKDQAYFEIPVHIEGPLDRPKIIPDLGAIAQNADVLSKGLKAAEKVFKDIKKKKISRDDFESLIQGVLGDSNTKRQSDQPTGPKEQSLQLQFFMQQ